MPNSIEDQVIGMDVNEANAVPSKSNKSNKNSGNRPTTVSKDGCERIMNFLASINEAMYTKDGGALKKSLDTRISAVQTELKAHNVRFTAIEERMSQFESKLVSDDYDRELTKQQTSKNNISIFGCPKYGDGNVMLTAIKVFKAFGA